MFSHLLLTTDPVVAVAQNHTHTISNVLQVQGAPSMAQAADSTQVTPYVYLICTQRACLMPLCKPQEAP